MKPRLYYFFINIVLFTACHADPGVISDDDTMPTLPGVPILECDSLHVPNQVFPNNIGDKLVFVDSIGAEFDTLICSNNEALSEKITDNNLKYCHEQYIAAYSTKWLPSPDVYSFEFNIVKSILTTYSVQSVPWDDFHAVFSSSNATNSASLDSISINDKLYKDVILYNCISSKPCFFLESLVTAKDAGLVSFKRKGKWWTKM